MTNVELSKRVGISAPPCLRRVRALEDAGYIQGYHADVNHETLGYGVTVFAQVGLTSQAENDLRAFEELVESWPEVRECHMLAGEADFILKVVAADWDTYNKFLTTELTSAPNVSHVKSARHSNVEVRVRDSNSDRRRITREDTQPILDFKRNPECRYH